MSTADALGVSFADPALLREALTHRSLVGQTNNQRLEFLGDRVLGLIVAESLMARFPQEDEGDLAPRLAALVSADSLTAVSQTIGLGRHLDMAPSETASGGRENDANLADACEALIGALYLDGGLAAAAAFVERHWRPLFKAQIVPPKDAKTALQEWSQARGLGLPHYRLISSEGPAHKPTFRMAVAVEGQGKGEGEAYSKREAERRAAETLLTRLAGDYG
ncbi:MAG: ribonuclease III [Alphaproteobacteria bacterium]|nr:ribonuclease III [Alphaproteobacteria bacterium]